MLVLRIRVGSVCTHESRSGYPIPETQGPRLRRDRRVWRASLSLTRPPHLSLYGLECGTVAAREMKFLWDPEAQTWWVFLRSEPRASEPGGSSDSYKSDKERNRERYAAAGAF